MGFLKQIFVVVFVILLFLSIYKDVTLEHEYVYTSKIDHKVSRLEYEIVSHVVNNGETVLSIVENINHGLLKEIEINDIIDDFIFLNPKSNVYELLPEKRYYFPKYKP